MRADRAPYKILPFSHFGLVAIVRKRVKQSLARAWRAVLVLRGHRLRGERFDGGVGVGGRGHAVSGVAKLPPRRSIVSAKTRTACWPQGA